LRQCGNVFFFFVLIEHFGHAFCRIAHSRSCTPSSPRTTRRRPSRAPTSRSSWVPSRAPRVRSLSPSAAPHSLTHSLSLSRRLFHWPYLARWCECVASCRVVVFYCISLCCVVYLCAQAWSAMTSFATTPPSSLSRARYLLRSLLVPVPLRVFARKYV
jgi:hypothetical protein